MIEVHQLPALVDNYAYLLRDPGTGFVAAVDAPESSIMIAFLDARGWKLDLLLNTHHHRDHVGGNAALVARYGCEVWAGEKDRARIPGIVRGLSDGEEFSLGEERVVVINADGHTIGQIAFWLPQSGALFCGDAIFSLGCGKLFEGTPRQMWHTLERLRALPDSTLIYGAHEYTLENAAYALHADPDNQALRMRVRECEALRSEGKFTVPSSMAIEKACNPFLRPESSALQRHVGAEGRELWEVFAALRSRKDEFDAAR